MWAVGSLHKFLFTKILVKFSPISYTTYILIVCASVALGIGIAAVLILVATILSLPVAYFTLLHWLNAYTYKITMGWMLFVIPMLLILVIAALTMSFPIIRTALLKPAETLKYE